MMGIQKNRPSGPMDSGDGVTWLYCDGGPPGRRFFRLGYQRPVRILGGIQNALALSPPFGSHY